MADPAVSAGYKAHGMKVWPAEAEPRQPTLDPVGRGLAKLETKGVTQWA